MAENIVHLVLARPEGAGPGTKGLSLFIVPKFHFDWETGELGERNGAYVTNVEHKMGLKASTTCELTFGESEPAVGWLVGEVHDGIAQMFKVIEYARMMVGTKAIATLSTGYLNALDYAKTRVQGPDLTKMTDKTAPRVPITHHPDVRRSLMLQKAYAEGMRALVLYTATVQDDIAAAEAAGTDATSAAHDLAVRLNDLLLPIVKGFGSEKSYELLGSQSLQTFGGSGYLQDYPIEQYIRDAKIDTLYEGTTAIQGMDFFFRKIVRDKGQALTKLMTDIQEFAKGDDGNGALQAERDLLATALEDVQGIVGAMVGLAHRLRRGRDQHLQGRPEHDPAAAGLRRPGLGWLLLRQAAVAQAALDAGASGRDQAFYQGKVAAATFFARQALPLLTRPARRGRGRRQRADGASRRRPSRPPGRGRPVCGTCRASIGDRVVVGCRRRDRGTPPGTAVTACAAAALTRASTQPGGTMGIGVSIFLIAVGAILAFAVDSRSAASTSTVVGYILMIVGLVGLIMTAFIWGPRRSGAAATSSRSAGSTTTASRPRSWPAAPQPADRRPARVCRPRRVRRRPASADDRPDGRSPVRPGLCRHRPRPDGPRRRPRRSASARRPSSRSTSTCSTWA